MTESRFQKNDSVNMADRVQKAPDACAPRVDGRLTALATRRAPPGVAAAP